MSGNITREEMLRRQQNWMAQHAAQKEREAIRSEFTRDDTVPVAASASARRPAQNGLSADQVLDKITERITGRLREEIRQEVFREEKELAARREKDETEQMGKLEGFLAGRLRENEMIVDGDF